jgi:opine dehydrogenase
MKITRIAVLGGGPGGHAAAGDLAMRGFEVHFWARNAWRLAPVFQFKQIKLIGVIDGTAQLADASDDLGRILKKAQLIFMPLPATAQREMAERCAPFLEDGQVVLVSCHGGMGSVEFARVLREKGIKKDVICAEYPGLPYGARLLEEGIVNVPHSFQYAIDSFSKRIGVFPAKRTAEAMEIIAQAYPGTPAAQNSLASSLISEGIVHQSVLTLTGLSAIETFIFWNITEDGLTPTVRKLTIACDNERKAIEAAWGFAASELNRAGFETAPPKEAKVSKPAPPSKKVKWAYKERLDDIVNHRYIQEAVPYGLVLRASAARRAGVATPLIDSLINLYCCIAGENFAQTGRTLDSLGLKAKGVEETNRLLDQGWD